jgi:hypothetical protein
MVAEISRVLEFGGWLREVRLPTFRAVEQHNQGIAFLKWSLFVVRIRLSQARIGSAERFDVFLIFT